MNMSRSKSKIPSPARSHGAPCSPMQRRRRKCRSVCSATSNSSVRLTDVISDSFQLSPLPKSHSVLNDETNIELSHGTGWWNRLGNNSEDITTILNEQSNDDIITAKSADEMDADILSQEKENFTLDLSESSQSIHSIVMPAHKLFTHKHNKSRKKLKDLEKTNDNSASLKKSYFAEDKEINVRPKKLFNQLQKPKTKPVFDDDLLSTSLNKTMTKSAPNIKRQVRNLFNNRPEIKRQNIYAAFIATDSEDEIPELQSKMFGFQTRNLRKYSSPRISELCSSTSTTADLGMDSWKHLPSSTMVDVDFDEAEIITPMKKVVEQSNHRENKSAETKLQEECQINEEQIESVKRNEILEDTMINQSNERENESDKIAKLISKEGQILECEQESESHVDDNSEQEHDVIEYDQDNENTSPDNENKYCDEPSPNITNDDSGPQRMHSELAVKSPETVIHDNRQNRDESFTIPGRNSSNRKSKTTPHQLNIRPMTESIRYSDVLVSSSAEGSGWDSHRTLRKTIGRDFTLRKSLRTLVMEKSVRRKTDEDFANQSNRETEVNDISRDNTRLSETRFSEHELESYHGSEPIEGNEAVEESSQNNETLEQREDFANQSNRETEVNDISRDNTRLSETRFSEHELESYHGSEPIEGNEAVEESSQNNETLEQREDFANQSNRETEVNDISRDNTRLSETTFSEHELESYHNSEPIEGNEAAEESSQNNETLERRELENFIQRIRQKPAEEMRKVQEEVRSTLESIMSKSYNPFKMPELPKPIRRITKTLTKKPVKPKPKRNQLITDDMLPPEFLNDMKYKPPKRYQGRNAPWITKRLYAYLEKKLEPKYDYLARVRAERLVKKLYEFVKQVRRLNSAPQQSIDDLKFEMARLNIVKTHYDFYNFFHDFMPRDVRIRVNPDILNKLPMPENVFGNVIQEDLSDN